MHVYLYLVCDPILELEGSSQGRASDLVFQGETWAREKPLTPAFPSLSFLKGRSCSKGSQKGVRGISPSQAILGSTACSLDSKLPN